MELVSRLALEPAVVVVLEPKDVVVLELVGEIVENCLEAGRWISPGAGTCTLVLGQVGVVVQKLAGVVV
jgi:hypothetical protein